MTRPPAEPKAGKPASEFDARPAAGHEFEHGSEPGGAGQRLALRWALGLNATLLVAEVAGGVAFGSLALVADAAHLLSDVTGLAIALGALVLTARPVSSRHSFGLARAEVLAAQVNALLLLMAGGWILLEGLTRLRHPVPVDGAGLAWVATVGLLVNTGSALLIHRSAGASLNMRASFTHLATDAAGSFGAIIAGLLIVNWHWPQADSLVSMATAVLVLAAAWRLLRDTTHVLMEGTPRGMDAEQVRTAILDIEGVAEIHHLHIWNLASDVPALSAHLVVTGNPTLRASEQISGQVRTALQDRFAITHTTLQLECTPPADTAGGPAGSLCPAPGAGSTAGLGPPPAAGEPPPRRGVRPWNA